MIKKLFFGALSLSVLNANTQTISNVDWVKYKTERAQISNVPSAIDANNNAFITGYMYVSGNNVNANTVKYSPTGAELWMASYDYNGGFDNSKAIILDAGGNSYITGESDGTGTQRDIFVVKYDPNGLQLFAFRWNGASNGNDCGNAITLDAIGNIYVTGFTTNMAGTKDYVTIKLNNSGVQQFAVITNGTGNLNDEAVAIGFNNNRLYVTGNSTNASGNTDLLTLRINPANGATVWSKTENGSANSNDMAYALLPYNNDVVVVGQVNNTTTNNDYITKYYNGVNGNTVWSKIYDSNNTNGGASALAIDASGNFAVTGIVNNANIYEYHTLLYNNSGVQQWVNISSTNLGYVSALPQIAVDPTANHFYVCGQKLGVQSDICVYQITPTGNKTWEEIFNGAQNGTDAAVDLVVNAQGIIYVAGASYNSNAKYDYTTIRISQTPVYFPIDLNNQPSNQFSSFTPNLGQLHDQFYSQINPNDIKYYNTSISPAVFIKENKNSFQFIKSAHDTASLDTIFRIDMSFGKDDGVGTLLSKLYSYEPVEATQNFYTVNTGQNGITDLKARQRLLVPNIYPNVDLHYYSNKDGLKYYFVVKPGGSPNSIFLNFNGCGSSYINGNNELVATAGWDNLKFKQPDAYQIGTGMNVLPIGSATWNSLGGNAYSITTPSYNPALPLIVMVSRPATPLAVAQTTFWSTYLGSYGDDVALDVVTDFEGGVYVAGFTTDAMLYQLNVGNTTVKGAQDAIAIKFDKNAILKWTNIYGGSASEEFRSTDFLNFGGKKEICFTGYSSSNVIKATIIPFPNPNDGTHWDNLASGSSDALIVKITHTLGTISYAQYIGGGNGDVGKSIAVDNVQGRIYIAGNTNDPNNTTTTSFPFKNPGGSSYFTNQHGNAGSAANDGFIFCLSHTNTLQYSTIIGGDAEDGIEEIAVSPFGDFYITGATTSSLSQQGNVGPYLALNDSKFPLGTWIGGYNQTTRASSVLKSGFISRFNGNFGLDWSTLFNGDGDGSGTGIAVSKNGDLFATGFSYSTKSSTVTCNVPNDDGFPVCAPFQTTAFGQSPSYADIYLARFTFNNFMNFSTLYGNNDDENAPATIGGFGGRPKLTVEKNNNVFVTGATRRDVSTSNAFPVQNKAGLYNQATNAGTVATLSTDAFMLWFDNTSQRTWATHYGGGDNSTSSAGDETGNGVAIFNSTQLYMVGSATTYSLPFACPTSSGTPYCKNNNSNSADAFIARFDMGIFIGIEESNLLNTDNELTVFPNPSNGNINIVFKGRELDTYSLEIYNVLGQMLYKKNLGKTFGQHTETVDVSHYSSGMYIVNLVSSKESVSRKIIKQ